MKEQKVEIKDKYLLTVEEAAAYFNIGTEKIRNLTDNDGIDCVVFNGVKRLIKRQKMEKYLEKKYEI